MTRSAPTGALLETRPAEGDAELSKMMFWMYPTSSSQPKPSSPNCSKWSELDADQ